MVSFASVCTLCRMGMLFNSVPQVDQRHQYDCNSVTPMSTLCSWDATLSELMVNW